MHTYTHIHKQTNSYAQLQILFTHAHIHADNTYVHVSKYIYIPVHTYTNTIIQTWTHKDNFRPEHVEQKKVFKQKYFHSKKIDQININAHINKHTNACTKTLFTDTY